VRQDGLEKMMSDGFRIIHSGEEASEK